MSTDRQQTVKWVPFTEREPDEGAHNVLIYSTVSSSPVQLNRWWDTNARDNALNIRASHWCQVIKPELPR